MFIFSDMDKIVNTTRQHMKNILSQGVRTSMDMKVKDHSRFMSKYY